MNSLYGGFIASIVVRGVGAVAALGVNVWLARLLGVVNYGRYMALLSLALVLGGLATRGVDQLFTRDLGTAVHTGSGASRTLFRWGAMRVLFGVVLAAMGFVAWVAWSGKATDISTLFPTFLAGALLITLFSFVTLLVGGINGLNASLRSQSLPLIIQNGAILLFIGITVLVSGGLTSAVSVLWLQAGAYLVAAVVGVVWLLGLLQQESSGGDDSVAKNSTAETKGWSRSSNHYMWMSIAALLMSRLDIVLVSSLSGDATAGVYSVGARLAQVALMVPLAVNVVLSPRIAGAWVRGDYGTVRTLVVSGLSFTVPIALIEIALAVFFGPQLVSLFGPEYGSASTPFMWVTLAYALWTVAAPGYALMAMTGSEKAVAGLSWAILVMNVLGIVVLVPRYGATGGAIAMALGYALVIPPVLGMTRSKLADGKRIAASKGSVV